MPAVVQRLQAVLNPDGAVMSRQLELQQEASSEALPALLQAAAAAARLHDAPPRSLPERYLSPEAMVFLNIPMDAETPSMRLLRPQVGACVRAAAACWLADWPLRGARSFLPLLPSPCPLF